MASFTDTQIPQFNPYIQQLPVEAMVTVGTQKQKAFEEGVQKIQTQIDNIAGLDVVRDVDKAYLQSKLNELGNKLRTVAGGDFSNFQLVNSVGGMTKQLINDNNIKNAVQSTAKYRKEVENMNASVKDGKSSIANQWVFGQDSSEWLNSSNLEESFNVKYQPYTDVNKKWVEVMKTLKPDLVEQDIPYERNNDGTINYTKTAAAMQRLSKETLSAEKIANALNASLSPDDLNQLKIDGRYQFRGHTPESLAETSEKKYTSLIKDNTETLKELEGLVALSSSNPGMKKKAQDAIDSIKLQNSILEKNKLQEMEFIKTNPEAAKGMIYQNGAIAQFSKANSWEHNKSNLLTNPVLEAEHWEKNQALEQAKFALSQRKQNWDEKMDVAGHQLAVKNYELNVAKQHAELYGLPGTFEAYGGTSTKIKDPMTSMINEANEYDAAVSSGIVEMVKAMPGTNSVQIKNALKKYEAGDPNWFKLGTDSKSIIPANVRKIADGVLDNRREAKRLNTAIKQTIDEVDKSATVKDTQNKILASVSDLPTLVGIDANGKSTVFSRKEIVDFIGKRYESRGVSISSPLTMGTGEQYGRKITYSTPLTQREKLLEKSIGGLSAYTFGQYVDRTRSKLHEFTKNRDKMIEQKLLEKGSSFIPRQTTINFGSGEGNLARRSWEGTINTALAPYGDRLNAFGVTGGTEELTEDDYNTAKEWITGDKRDQIIYSKIEQGSKTFIQLSLGGKDVLVPIRAESVPSLPMSPDKGSPSPGYKKIVKAQMLGNGSTNITGKFEDCYYGKSNIKSTRLNIGADLVWDKTNVNQQFINLQLKTPIGTIPLMYETPVDRNQAESIILSLTDKDIKDIYLESPLVTDKEKEVIKKL